MKVKVYNETGVDLHAVRQRKLVGRIKNNWRQRNVELYESDGTTPEMLFMVGTTFDGSAIIVSHEVIGLNEKVAMDYWEHGNKVLVRD